MAVWHLHEHVIWQCGVNEGVDNVVLDYLEVESRGNGYQSSKRFGGEGGGKVQVFPSSLGGIAY